MQVVPVGSAPDLVIASGGFFWVTHHILRDFDSAALRNAGDRTLTRVDPSTGKATAVGNGLAPCGLAADPSGDVWVANCFEPGSGQTSNIVRVDAKTLAFKATWPVPGGQSFYRGLAAGGGSVWVSDGHGGNTVTQVNPQTGAKKAIRLDRPTGVLVWSKAHGDLWINNFTTGSLTRLHAKTGAAEIVDNVATNPSFPAVAGDTVWAGDWSSPQVVRLHAVGSPRPPQYPPTRHQRIRRCLERRRRCRLHLGDHPPRRRTVADQSTHQHCDPHQHGPPANRRHRDCKPGMGHCPGEVTDPWPRRRRGARLQHLKAKGPVPEGPGPCDAGSVPCSRRTTCAAGLSSGAEQDRQSVGASVAANAVSPWRRVR